MAQEKELEALRDAGHLQRRKQLEWERDACRSERDRRLRELQAAARALAREEKLQEQKDRDELAQKEALRVEARAAKRAQKVKKAQERVAGWKERKQKRKALKAQQREDAECARSVTLRRDTLYYCVCAIMSLGVVFLMRNSLCSLLVTLATVLISNLTVVGVVALVVALVVLALWMHPSRELTTCSQLLLAGFVVLSLLHLTVFVNATSAMLQGSTYPGFQAGENGVDSRASGPQESVLMQSSPVTFLDFMFISNLPVVGAVALVVLAQWMHPCELTTCSQLLLVGFVALSLLHLTVFDNATSAMLQGSTYPGFQAGENGVDSRASGPQESVLMQSSPVTILHFVYSLAWVVLIALNLYTEHVLFLGLAVACCVGFKPCALALSLCLVSVDSYVASEFALFLLVYVGRPLGLRLDVRAYALSHDLCWWAGLVFGSLDMIWRGGDLNWKMVTLMGGGASSTTSWIGCFISSMASWLYSEGSEVVSLWPEVIASLICIFAISTVIDQFSEHLVVRLVCFFGGPYLVNATGDPWIVIKQASAVICIEGLALYVTSSRVASSESTSGIGHCCSTETTISNSVPGAACANARNSCACASSGVDVDECGGPDGSTECSFFTRSVTAFKWFIYGSVLWRSSHLGSWFEMFGTASSASGDAIATIFARGTDCTGSVNVYAVLSVASGTGPVVVAIVLVACSSWAALRDRHCLEDGSSFIISVRTAATTFALLINCLALWYSGLLGSLFETLGTASGASGDAIATIFTRGTDCTGSVNVYAVLSVASGTGPVVVAIVLVACSSWAALRDRHCLEDGSSFIISVRTAATTFALLINCLALWYSGLLGSLFETLGTASGASGDAIATIFTRGTDCMGSLTVYAVLFVTVAVVGVLRVRDAKPHVPNNVPGAFASNTCKDTCCGAGTRSVPAMAQSKARKPGPITRLFDLIGQSISGYPVVQHRLLGGAPKKKKPCKYAHKGCPFSSKLPGPLANHEKTCSFGGLGKPAVTTAPDRYEESDLRCWNCRTDRLLGRLGQLWFTCRCWGQEGHLGHPGYLEYYAQKLQEKNDTQNELRAATSGGKSGQSKGDDITKWNEPYPGGPAGETRRQALINYIKAFPRWRLSPQQPLCEMLAQRLGVNDWQKVSAELSRLDPANATGYRLQLDYEPFVRACLALVNFPGGDPIFGGLDPLTMVLLGGLVSGAIALEAATLIRAMKPLSRKNAAGARSREGVRDGLRHSASRGNEFSAAILENDHQSGLRGESRGGSWFERRWGHLGGFDLGLTSDCLVNLRDRGLRIFRIAPHGLSSFIGCDFGTLAKQDTVLQAFNVKAPLDLAVGNSTTRTISRPGNNAIAVGLSALTGTESLELHIKLHAGLIIVYTGLGGVNWKAKVIAAYQHFSRTYDPVVFAKKSPDACRSWLKNLMCPNDWGGVIDGYDICFFINDALFGRDLLSEPMDLAIYDATDRNLERIARGIKLDLSYLPVDNWPGVKSLRQSCLEACMSAADDALMIYWVVFKEKLEAALERGEGVCEIVADCYGSIRYGFERAASAEEALEMIRAEFLALHAPGILAELAEPRRVDILTYDGRDLEKAPVARVKTVDRATSLAPAPAPAPPALQPYNAAKRGSSADAGGDAKRTRCPAILPMAL